MSVLYVWGVETTIDDELAIESLNAKGIDKIGRERAEQFIKHRRSVKDDVFHHPNGELVQAARALMKENCVPHDFPESWGVAACRKLSLKPYTERLVIAGALLAAEVDRRLYIQDVLRTVTRSTAKELGYYPLTPDQAFKTNDESNRNL